MHKYIITLVGIATVLFSFNACAPVPPPRTEREMATYTGKTTDPRFIGTWVTGYGGSIDILTLSPDGRGRIYSRKRGKFDDAKITWSTRSNLLVLKRAGEWGIIINDYVGHKAFNSEFILHHPVHRHGKIPYNPQEKYFRMSVVSYRKEKFIARSLVNPSNRLEFYRYSGKPTHDPYSVYAWFDGGGTRKIDANR